MESKIGDAEKDRTRLETELTEKLTTANNENADLQKEISALQKALGVTDDSLNRPKDCQEIRDSSSILPVKYHHHTFSMKRGFLFSLSVLDRGVSDV